MIDNDRVVMALVRVASGLVALASALERVRTARTGSPIVFKADELEAVELGIRSTAKALEYLSLELEKT